MEQAAFAHRLQVVRDPDVTLHCWVLGRRAEVSALNHSLLAEPEAGDDALQDGHEPFGGDRMRPERDECWARTRCMKHPVARRQ